MNLSDEQKFAIRWCYARANDYVEQHSPTKNPYDHYTGQLDLLVNSVTGKDQYNITQIIKELLGTTNETLSPPIQSKPAELTLGEKVDDLINELMKENKVKAIKKLKRMLNERL